MVSLVEHLNEIENNRWRYIRALEALEGYGIFNKVTSRCPFQNIIGRDLGVQNLLNPGIPAILGVPKGWEKV